MLERIPQRTASRWFARAAQAATWTLAVAWTALIVLASGVATSSSQPLVARLPDLIATCAFVAAILVGAAVVHTVLEAAIAILRIAGDARSLPAIEKNVRLNAQLPSVIAPPPQPAEPEPRVARPIARPIGRPASA